MRSKRVRYTALVAALAIFIAAAVAFSPEVGIVAVGAPVPTFEVENARTGAAVSLDDYAGKVVLVNIWATWCGPCKVEMPSMERLYNHFRGTDFEIAAVSVDVKGSDAVVAFTDELGLTFDILHDQRGEINQAYQVTGYPESFLIDRYGTIIKKVIGPEEWDSPDNVALIERLLAEEI